MSPVVYRGESVSFAGTWETWKEAAVARDRAILFLGYTDQRLNFPALSKRRGPASIEELTRESHAKRKLAQSSPSPYRGVTQVSKRGARWEATIKLRGRRALFLGKWRTARLAAEAHDRAARFYELPDRCLNFIERKSELAPADAETLSAEAHRSFKATTSSRFHGVCFYRARNSWIAYVAKDGKRHNLGYFKHEIEAARAYDKTARKLHGKDAKLNFAPGTDEELLGRRVAARAR